LGGTVRFHQYPVHEFLAVWFFVAWFDKHADIVKRKCRLAMRLAGNFSWLHRLLEIFAAIRKLFQVLRGKSLKMNTFRRNRKENIFAIFSKNMKGCRTWGNFGWRQIDYFVKLIVFWCFILR
jgi:hypothetical protein